MRCGQGGQSLDRRTAMQSHAQTCGGQRNGRLTSPTPSPRFRPRAKINAFALNALAAALYLLISAPRGAAAKVRLGNLKARVRGVCRDVKRVLRTLDAGRRNDDAGRVGLDILRPVIWE